MSHNTSDSAVGCAIQSICERIDSPSSRELSSAIASGLFKKLVFDYGISEQTQFAEDYFITKILSKWKGWRVSGVDPKRAARDAWLGVEMQCFETNKRLTGLMRGTGYPGSYLISVISAAQNNISKILGRFDVSRVLQHCSWGPGATADLPRGTHRDQKMTRRMSTTRPVIPYIKALIESDPVWTEAILGFYPCGPYSIVPGFWNVVDSARFETVPKEVSIDRSIDIQPTANGFVQSGTGKYMRARLKLFGIDLNSQEANQLGALLGYFDDRATVDLRSASDSNAAMLCTLLLPWEWDQWLNKLRTPYTTFPDGSKHLLQKISAMGNGFTFELETIVFYAIAKAVCEVEKLSQEGILVYGDDIIIPGKAYDGLVYALNYLGFEINPDKSFKSGNFRESCGKHYFRGADVTPAYQKNLVNSPEECIRFYNRLVRWSGRTYNDPWRFEEALTMIILQFQSYWDRESTWDKLPKIPWGSVSDDGFLMPLDQFDIGPDGDILTYVFRKTKKRSKAKLNETAYYALKLRSVVLPSSETDNFIRENGVCSIFDYLSANPLNSSREGHVYEDSGLGRYRSNKARIFATSYLMAA
jgi:hypothetical protein